MKSNQSIKELIDQWLSELDVNEGSRETYRRCFRQFQIWAIDNSVKVRTIKTADIVAYKRHLINTKAGRTADLYFTTIRRFFAWLKLQRIYSNPTEGIKNPRKPKAFKKLPLTVDQVRRLFDVVPATSKGLRDIAILNLMIRSGLRTIEVARLDVGDITELKGNIVARVQGKGRTTKDQLVSLRPKSLDAINNYLVTRENFQDTDPLFIGHSPRNRERLKPNTIGKMVKFYLRAAGINSDQITAHSLRHTTADLMLRHGAPLYDVMVTLRHSSPVITTTYLKSIEREKALSNPASSLLDDLI